MKKQIFILLVLCFPCLIVTGCTSDTAEQVKSPQVNTSDAVSVIEQNITENSITSGLSENTAQAPSSDSAKKNLQALQSETSVDIDLTVLSSTMVYAEVYNIMMDSDSYVGKTIKGRGIYDNFYYEKQDKYFHYFIISDATGCCPQGIDFVWSGEHIYPDDYPELGENIEVTGVFTKGEVEGKLYYYVIADSVLRLD